MVEKGLPAGGRGWYDGADMSDSDYEPTPEDDAYVAFVQPNSALARMIAVHHTPPGISPDSLARDIETVLNARCRSAFKPGAGGHA
jgi:hypothetical protein